MGEARDIRSDERRVKGAAVRCEMMLMLHGPTEGNW